MAGNVEPLVSHVGSSGALCVDQRSKRRLNESLECQTRQIKVTTSFSTADVDESPFRHRVEGATVRQHAAGGQVAQDAGPVAPDDVRVISIQIGGIDPSIQLPEQPLPAHAGDTLRSRVVVRRCEDNLRKNVNRCTREGLFD